MPQLQELIRLLVEHMLRTSSPFQLICCYNAVGVKLPKDVATFSHPEMAVGNAIPSLK